MGAPPSGNSVSTPLALRPALTFVGYTDAAGRAYSHLETNDFTARIEDYQRLQYNNLFGGQDRLAAFFDPESGGATGG